MKRVVLFVVSFLGSIFCSNLVFWLPEHSSWYGASMGSFANIADQMVGMFVSLIFLALGLGMLLVPSMAPIKNERPGQRFQMGWGFALGAILGMILVLNQ